MISSAIRNKIISDITGFIRGGKNVLQFGHFLAEMAQSPDFHRVMVYDASARNTVESLIRSTYSSDGMRIWTNIKATSQKFIDRLESQAGKNLEPLEESRAKGSQFHKPWMNRDVARTGIMTQSAMTKKVEYAALLRKARASLRNDDLNLIMDTQVRAEFARMTRSMSFREQQEFIDLAFGKGGLVSRNTLKDIQDIKNQVIEDTKDIFAAYSDPNYKGQSKLTQAESKKLVQTLRNEVESGKELGKYNRDEKRWLKGQLKQAIVHLRISPATFQSSEIIMPYGAYRGQKLKDLPAYYIANLFNRRNDDPPAIARKFDPILQSFKKHPWVQQILREHEEDKGERSPRDLQPYYDPYDPKTWETDLSWREPDRTGGFATSDPWEAAYYGRSRTERGIDPDYYVMGELGRRDREGYGHLRQIPHYRPRRGEQRGFGIVDPDYFASKTRSEHMKVLKPWSLGRRMFKRTMDEIPRELVEYGRRRYDPEKEQWIEEVRTRQKYGLVLRKLGQARQYTKDQQYSEAERYIADLEKQENLQRAGGRFGPDMTGVDPEHASDPALAVYARRNKLKGVNIAMESYMKQLAAEIMQSPNVEALDKISQDLEHRFGMEHLEEQQPQFVEMMAEKRRYLEMGVAMPTGSMGTVVEAPSKVFQNIPGVVESKALVSERVPTATKVSEESSTEAIEAGKSRMRELLARRKAPMGGGSPLS